MNLLFYERNALRYETDFIVQVQLKSWNPFLLKKAKLIDISWSGFKLEFFENVQLKNTDTVRLIFSAPIINEKFKKLKVKAMVKWYDPLHKKVGGVYIPTNKITSDLLANLIASVSKEAEAKAAEKAASPLAQNKKSEQKE